MIEIQSNQLANILHDALTEIEQFPLIISDKKKLIQENPVSVIYIDMLVRFKSHFLLLYLVFQNVDENAELEWLEHSIGIILRSCLQDRILLNELQYDLDNNDGWNNKEQQKEMYIKHNSGQLKRVIEIINSFKKSSLEWYNPIDTELAKKNLIKEYPDFFKNGESDKLKYDSYPSNFPSTKISGKSPRVEEDAYHIFDLWEYYSKYEHYGPLSSILLNKSPKEKWNKIVVSIAHSLNGLVYIFDSMKITKKTVPLLTSKIDELYDLKI